MYHIYEFRGNEWSLWSNKLPLPVFNNTVVSIEDNRICDTKGKRFDKNQLLSGFKLKPDRSVNRVQITRCYEFYPEMVGYQAFEWFSWFHSDVPLKDLSCIQRIRSNKRRQFSFSFASNFCSKVKSGSRFANTRRKHFAIIADVVASVLSKIQENE